MGQFGSAARYKVGEMQQVLRAAVILLFGIVPSLVFFWWIVHGCEFWYFSGALMESSGGRDVLWNAFLFCTFGIVHSVLAEIGVNRLVYLIVAGVTSLAVIAFWVPALGTLWQVGGKELSWWFGTVQFLVWLAIHNWIIATGGWAEFLGIREMEKRLITSGPYALCRHPMHANILFSLLLTPHMTADRLTMLTAVGLYLLAAIPIEEARLQESFGLEWRSYKAQTPLLIPGVL